MHKEELIKIGTLLAGVAGLFAIIDYLVYQWGILPVIWNYLWTYIKLPLQYAYTYPFETFVLVWLAFLTWLAGGGRTIISEGDFIGISLPKDQQLRIDHVSKSDVDAQAASLRQDMKVSGDRITAGIKEQISTAVKPITTKITSIEYALLELEIANHLSKKQIGALSCLIKKLKLDIKKEWGVEATLMEIKEYITDKGMPDVYFSDLTNVLKLLPDELAHLKSELTKLAQEKLYNINK
jgi:hypothetical protein